LRFLLVDRILELESGKRARGIKNVAMSEDFLTHHFPDTPIMPGALIAEAAVQLASWVIREATDFRRAGLAVVFERARFQELVRPGDQLELEVEVLAMDDATARFKAVAHCRGRRVSSGRFVLALVDAETQEAVDESRRLFKILSLPLEGPAR
jgi:3-hydroxyacyl-[acyl-carrier-protein] dehydratase